LGFGWRKATKLSLWRFTRNQRLFQALKIMRLLLLSL